VLLAFHDLAALAAEPARRGLAWLTTVQNADGGWGSAPHTPSRGWETAAVVRVLADVGAEYEAAYHRGLAWLVQEIEAGRLTEATDCGSPPVILWHNEPLVPIIFAAAALGRARVRAAAPAP
jgi:squalene-hopene/tetraprenyl-beta-curcumene cyclase